MPNRTREAILRHLARRGLFHINPGLERVSRILSFLGNPQDQIRAVHIAGTNGKGSVAASLESVMRHAGFHTGLYTSPHLWELRERIQIDRHPITQDDFDETAARVLDAERSTSIRLTYFEFVTVMAFLKFAGEPVEIAIIETGLGGRWDATNVLKRPELSVITSIGRDHMQWLGKTVEAIAAEKAGIIKAGRPLVSGAQGNAAKVIATLATLKKAPYRLIDKHYRAVRKRIDWVRGTQTIRFGGSSGYGTTVKVPLLGTHQVDNAAVTIAAVESLRKGGWSISAQALHRGLQKVEWPGRFQFVRNPQRPIILFDGAHNVPALQELLKTVASSPWAHLPKTIVFSVYRDKEYQKMIELLAESASQVVVCTMPGRRALSSIRTARIFCRKLHKDLIHRVSDPLQALERAISITPLDGIIIATGSLALIGMLLKPVPEQSGELAPAMADNPLPQERHV